MSIRASAFFCALILHTSMACGQDLESWRATWQDTAERDSVRFTALYDLVWEGYLFSEPDSAFALATEMFHQAERKSDRFFMARAWDLMAATWYVRGDLKMALTYYDSSLTTYEEIKNSEGLADVITNMASMRTYLGEYDEVMALYERGLAMHVEQHDSTSWANDLNSIGRVHFLRGDHSNAIHFYEQSLQMQRSLGNERGIATSLMNLGSIYNLQNDPAKSLTLFTEAEVMGDRLNDQHLLGKILMEKGVCHEALGDSTAAMDHYQRSLQTREAIEDEAGIVGSMNKIAALQFAMGDPKQALATYTKVFSQAHTSDVPFGVATALIGAGTVYLHLNDGQAALERFNKARPFVEDAETLSLDRDWSELGYFAYKKVGRPADALRMHERYTVLQDSVMREENQREILRFEFADVYQQKALEDSLAHRTQQHDAELRHAATIAQERSTRNLILAGLVLVAVIAIGIWARMRYMARANRAIMAAQVKLLESERQREAEKVRTRIASDIHDDLGSDLTKLGLLGREIKHAAAEHAASTMALAERIVGLSADATAALGDIVWAADPHQDSARGLVDRASIFVHRLLEDIGIEHQLEFVHNGEDRMLDPGTKHDIFMLLKELINNALKHSGASRIEASLITDAQRFRIRVRDNGKGFDIAGTRKGNGLRSIEARSARISATVDPNSAPGDGCTVYIEGPLDRPDNPLTN